MCQVPECTGRKQMSPGAAAAELWAQPKALDGAGAPGREKLPSASPGSLCLWPGQHTAARTWGTHKQLPTCRWTHPECTFRARRREHKNLDILCTVQGTFDHLYTDSGALKLKGAPYLKFKSWFQHISTDIMRQKFEYILYFISHSLCDRVT